MLMRFEYVHHREPLAAHDLAGDADREYLNGHLCFWPDDIITGLV